MKVHYDLPIAEWYLSNQRKLTLQHFVPTFESILNRIQKFKKIDPGTKILEVGTGIGWFPILCKKHGISCEGLDICPQFVDYAFEFGKSNGIEPDIRLGNIEDEDIGHSIYDIIIALSTFEHVEHWQGGLRNIYNALRPGGLFYFYSSNRFTPRSGECDMPLPFYGLLPKRWRYRIQISRFGEEITKWGMDFNQFNPFELKRFFLGIGYQRVIDQFGIVEPSDLIQRKWWKVVVLKLIHCVKPLRWLGLVFLPGTCFICIK